MILVPVLVLLILSPISVMSDEDRHVIVVGGGLAGLSAAIEAADRGAKVTLIEGEKNLGGNSAKASSGINGVGTKAQELLKIEDSEELFLKDTVTAGHNVNKGDLASMLVHHSRDAVEWVMDKGVNLMDINLCGGHSRPRTHWIPSPAEGKPTPVGITIIRALAGHFDTLIVQNPDRVKLMLNVKVDRIAHKSGKIIGVHVVKPDNSEEVIAAEAVILATGGYSNDRADDGLLKEFAPDKMVYPTTNGPFALGSGVKMARKLHANLVNMDAVQIHPTGFIDPKDPNAHTKFLAAEALRGSGAILINQIGRRFANELGTRDYLTSKIWHECSPQVDGGKVAFLVMNERAISKFGWPAFNFYWKVKKFFTEYKNLEAVAEALSMTPSTLSMTLSEYNVAADGKREEPFGKTVFPVKFQPEEKLFVALVTPSIHYTMGGIEIDSQTRVIDNKHNVISGLYAAGEVSGGVHGDNRLAGNSLLECVVFGRVAGVNAARGKERVNEEL